ncbi:MAG TPA: helix-turn-helix domain-containing protein [Solirubrobacterales bacterium]|nr:helix-turn-helix domain-containing protein [Solirubrobacterales bacterium]
MASYLGAIADPVRLRVVRHLAEHESSSLQELAEAAGVHQNTVRAHLAALERTGLVARESESQGGRGRPRLRYRLAEGWAIPVDGFLALTELLAAALLRVGPSSAELRSLGMDWGRYLLGRPGDRDIDIARELPRVLERLGFQARVMGGELRLSGCPCPIVAPERPELICGLTDAVIEGVLTGSHSGIRVGLGKHDPGRRRCTLKLEPAKD